MIHALYLESVHVCNKNFFFSTWIFFFVNRVADEFDDADDDDNIELDAQEEDVENIELLAPGEVSGGVQKSKRITTRYMTK